MRLQPIWILLLLSLLSTPAKAQFVTINDPYFAAWLQTNYASCMSGNQMDTTCSTIINETTLSIYDADIYDLNGLQYFDNLERVTIAGNYQNPELPIFYHGLDTLVIHSCQNFYDLYNPLPNNMKVLAITGCPLTFLPNYPDSLIVLQLSDTWVDLSNTPGSIPSGLKHLDVSLTGTDSLPALPNGLEILHVHACSFVPGGFPSQLPDSLVVLGCSISNITTIPPLPNNLEHLAVNSTNITTLPNLPSSLTYLNASGTSITELPTLPEFLDVLQVNNCNIHCLPIIPEFLTILKLQNNPFACVRNYTPEMYSTETWLLSYPYCEYMDTVTNPFGCASITGIAGTVYKDSLNDCIQNANDPSVSNIPVKLYDDLGTLIYTTSSSSNGEYFFSALPNSYQVVIDTVNKPYQVGCNYPGIDSSITFSYPDSLIEGVNFLINCNSLTDVGVGSIHTNNWVFPGQQHILYVAAGDLSDWYQLNCPNSGSGLVSITVNGPVNYVSPGTGALTPVVNGLNFTYTISDFSLVNFTNDFALVLETQTTAQIGTDICVSVEVQLNGTDQDLNNNTMDFCYPILNSYDPNMKTVSPSVVHAEYNAWLYYTIYFQNIGTAPAFNVRLRDTLSALLDHTTFEVTGYSHTNKYYLTDNELYVHFQNIMLPDSTSDQEGSVGYFQYRIRPIDNINFGDSITNTAHIFFDYNDAIVTNTAVTNFIDNVSIGEFNAINISLHPNPNNGQFKITSSIKNNYLIQVFSIDGKHIYEKSINSHDDIINLSGAEPGMYILKASSAQGSKAIQFVIN